MIVTYRNHPIYTSDGEPAGVLDGDYQALPNHGQQPGWYALRKMVGGKPQSEVVANVHIAGVTT
ncbi:hypothetical protein [Novosphingobium sp. KACC 22771]|uniref:hypothetical protein n=1 Tax=Novosphingobium sp. KACC 22771 TaxID=3025670 RepID=UPI002366650F|nr:hypothetical protein [Novosphingobium sp. KACC 22771]WDF71469.1 hypothetical protein PQ467_11695 [Novosphingobium sp. KACC 22771]